MQFFGREKQIAWLRNIRSRAAENAKFTVITGRRRVGKTELVRHAYADAPFLYFFVARRTERELCEGFRNEIMEKLGIDLPGEQHSFSGLFSFLLKLSKDRPITLFIDEFQDFLRCNPGIYSDMQREWDVHHGTARINLIVCGSVNSLMNRIFRDKKEPLYGRQTGQLRLDPFAPGEIAAALDARAPAAAPDDLLALWAFTGGVAKYLALLLDAGAFSRDAMIDEMLSEGSVFIDEGIASLVEEFGRDYGVYFSILGAIAAGRNGRAGIETAIGAGDVGGYLSRLEKDYGIIERNQPLFAKPLSKNTRYRIGDEFFRFWFRFVGKYSAAVELGSYPVLRDIVRRDWNVFSGVSLERWFRASFAETGRFTRIGGWWDRKGENEIDLVAEDELNHEAVFCEIKRHAENISIGTLRNKTDAFLRVTGEYSGWRIRHAGLSLSEMRDPLKLHSRGR